ncbi:type VII secretion protein EccC [Actinoallomurus iriomotensis]|uniref:Type VII secretion protein EccC n=1 Tax=Actinoallomurus iriomotensis TaxID=478107 RepID=A0A9W6RZL2_9ACTN|nr:type VII secretion protein EccC [Actinoallomurus iriomotensis]
MILVLVDDRADRLAQVANVILALTVMIAVAGQLGRTSVHGPSAGVRPEVARRDYLRHLRQAHTSLSKVARDQRAALTWMHPAPERLWSIVRSSRLWERRPWDSDFGVARFGTGRQELAVRLIPPETRPIEELEPVSAEFLRRLLHTHSTLADLPLGIALPAFSRIVPAGERDAVCGMIRAAIMQLAAFHSPEDLRISVCASTDRIPYWEWIKWLPHASHPTVRDAAGPVRLFAENLAELEDLLEFDLAYRPRTRGHNDVSETPLHVVILDGGVVTPGSSLGTADVAGVCVIDLSGATSGETAETILRLEVSYDEVRTRQNGRTDATVWIPDHVGFPQAEALARQLAPLRVSPVRSPGEDYVTARMALTSLLDVPDAQSVDPEVLWRSRVPRRRLRVPIGVDTDGRPVELDLKEAAQSGDGPHGLCVGTAGSGKSELLRTLVLGLAMTHSPEVVNFVLVDFKGDGTFLGMERLRHVAALITDLRQELPLVDRMSSALHGELTRRQELLRAAGNLTSSAEYDRARAQGAELEPLPALFVVVDEFAELLTAKPDLAELFAAIGRVGRSLGIHLLLAAQRLDEAKLRGLETHLSYRIGLRTFSAMESRVVLGVPDAYELPAVPGNGYLKTGDSMVRFKAASVSGAHNPRRSGGHATDARQGGGGTRPAQAVPFGTGRVAPEVAEVPDSRTVRADDGDERSVLDVVVERLAGQGRPAHRIWLPPLDESPTLDRLLPRLSATPDLGLTTADWEDRGRLSAAVGVVDRPFDQRRETMWLRLSGPTGNVAVVGGPQSGKSTVLRTLVASLALTHTPQEVWFYCLDFGGGTFGGLGSLPHVGGVAGRLDPDRVHRTIAEVTAVRAERERRFAELGVDGIESYRRVHGPGLADVFLVIDNWHVVRQDFEPAEPVIADLAARGLVYGIHVVASANRWPEFWGNVRGMFGSRVELRLGDPLDSEFHRRAAADVPEGRPGRGITEDALHFLAALPRIDGVSGVDDLADGVAHLVHAVSDSWPGPAAPRVRMLPAVLPSSSLPAAEETGRRVPIGVDEDALAPVLLDFDAASHLLVIGESECGKSNLLGLIARALAERYTPEEARFVVLDYRRGLLEATDGEHRIAYAASAAGAGKLVQDVRGALAGRLPPEDPTPEQLRTMSWWEGPEVFVFVDDYELVAASSGNPLLPLAEFVSTAPDIGLHIILARGGVGAGRSMYDPIIQRVTDLASPVLIMSGDEDEGALAGVRPRRLPRGRGVLTDRRSGPRVVQTALYAGGEPGGVGRALETPTDA